MYMITPPAPQPTPLSIPAQASPGFLATAGSLNSLVGSSSSMAGLSGITSSPALGNPSPSEAPWTLTPPQNATTHLTVTDLTQLTDLFILLLHVSQKYQRDRQRCTDLQLQTTLNRGIQLCERQYARLLQHCWGSPTPSQ
ncbi:hypothetical protein [Heliophilum fasciatum]|uniref:hypothetical protein n=1 Tax=Heliophilum fasciatum TaxID=35700 RepID=UPI00104DDBEA|nr:hypothetical protein [Heliophilum fasciatum]MCW2277844.1 hypothetical protein [Heliophilum fasciatum]